MIKCIAVCCTVLAVLMLHVPFAHAEDASPVIDKNAFFKLTSKKIPGRSLHTFTRNDYRNQWLNINPELHTFFSPETTEELFARVQKLYALEIKTARHGIMSEQEMVDFMEEGGLLKALEMDRSAALKAMGKIDTGAALIKPLSKFTQYGALMPPTPPVKLQAEFDPVGAVYVSWPIYDTFVWSITAKLVGEIRTNAPTWIFVPNKYWQKAVTLYLQKTGINMNGVKFLHIPTNDVWARNWGQLNIFSGKDQTPAFIRAPLIGYAGGQPYAKGSSEAVAAFGQYMDVPVFQLPVVLEQGGNFITDGKGTMLCSEHVLVQNPDIDERRLREVIKDYYGCTQVILLPNQPGEICGHADMVAKFADENTIFVASAVGTPWEQSLDDMANTLSKAKSLEGKPYKVVRLPVPSNQLLGQDSKDWSYINSLTVNKKIIVPMYGAPEDEQALKIYKKTLPDHEIVGIDYRDYFFGAVHCQTQNVPEVVANKVK